MPSALMKAISEISPATGASHSQAVKPPRPCRAAAALALLLSAGSLRAAESWSMTSPNGLVRLTVQLADLGGKADYLKGKTCLYYNVEQGPENQRVVVVEDSPMGLKLQAADLTQDLRFMEATPAQRVEETYALLHGKRSQCRNQAFRQTLTFRGAAGLLMAIDLRAYDDGVAFRYRLPEQGAAQVLESEATGFALPQERPDLAAPSDKADTYSAGLRDLLRERDRRRHALRSGMGWSFPLLFRTADSQRWALITEANVGPNFCGTRLASAAPSGVYRIALPDPGEGNGTGAVKPGSDAAVGDALARDHRRRSPGQRSSSRRWCTECLRRLARAGHELDQARPRGLELVVGPRPARRTAPSRRSSSTWPPRWAGSTAGRRQLGHHGQRQHPRRAALRAKQGRRRAALVQLRRPAQHRHREAARHARPTARSAASSSSC